MSDPRDDFRAALDWAVAKAAAVTPAQLEIDSPNAGWTVRQLLEHVIGSAGFIVTAFGGTPPDASGDDPVADFAQAAQAAREAIADDAGLAREVDWVSGKIPAAALLGIFTPEFLVHGWDIASVTGQEAEAPAALAERVLQLAKVGVPAEGRNPQAFGPVVEAPAGSGPTRQLAAWLGR
ncbi:MAG: TIGR03086 family protein [Propionibacteriaceae bacterium]|jgi:uncharacterized protein (TIGR03086 family)|nr:TIGR03086 family protein [Propionibacteriaceae bacterium]